MSIKLFVKSFDNDKLMSRCIVLSKEESQFYVGKEICIDLTVNADFGEMPESELIGKTVIVDQLQPCEFIGVGVSICEE